MAEAEEENEEAMVVIHPAFLCPISQQIMRDPVVALDGESYERRFVAMFFDLYGAVSPKNLEALASTTLVPNLTLQEMVRPVLEAIDERARKKEMGLLNRRFENAKLQQTAEVKEREEMRLKQEKERERERELELELEREQQKLALLKLKEEQEEKEQAEGSVLDSSRPPVPQPTLTLREQIFEAVRNNDMEALPALLQRSEHDTSFSTWINKKSKKTLLHSAAQFGFVGVLKLLLEPRADGQRLDVNKIDAKRQTPYMIAQREGHTECVDFLKEQPDLYIAPAASETPQPQPSAVSSSSSSSPPLPLRDFNSWHNDALIKASQDQPANPITKPKVDNSYIIEVVGRYDEQKFPVLKFKVLPGTIFNKVVSSYTQTCDLPPATCIFTFRDKVITDYQASVGLKGIKSDDVIYVTFNPANLDVLWEGADIKEQ